MNEQLDRSSSEESSTSAANASATPPPGFGTPTQIFREDESDDLFESSLNFSTDSEDMRDAVTYEFVRSQRAVGNERRAVGEPSEVGCVICFDFVCFHFHANFIPSI